MKAGRQLALGLGSFAAGMVTYHLLILPWFLQVDRQFSIGEHWKRIEDYKAFVNNPANYESDPTTRGLASATVPEDPLPSLAALVAAGELIHWDLVFPKVPSNDISNRYWMRFVEDHEEIVEALGIPAAKEIQSGAHNPLHLNLWFKRSAENDVRELIQGLEALASEAE